MAISIDDFQARQNDLIHHLGLFEKWQKKSLRGTVRLLGLKSTNRTQNRQAIISIIEAVNPPHIDTYPQRKRHEAIQHYLAHPEHTPPSHITKYVSFLDRHRP